MGVGTYDDGTTLLENVDVVGQAVKRKPIVPGSGMIDPIEGLTGVTIPGVTDVMQTGTIYNENWYTTSNITNFANDLYNQYVTNDDYV